MNRTASRSCSVLRKWLPTAACSTSLTRFCIVPTIEMTFGARVSGTWICTCRSMREHEALAALRLDRRQVRVEVVRGRHRVGPVEREDRRRHDLRRVHARVDRVLAGAQRLLPDAAVAGTHDRAELELRARRVERRQADVGLDDRDLALVDDEHRHHLDARRGTGSAGTRRRAAGRAAGRSCRRRRGTSGSPGSCCAGRSCCRAAPR